MIKPRTLLLSIAAACIALLAAAMVLQHVMNMLPCPLCVIQRYLFLAIAIATLGGVAARQQKWGAGTALLCAVGGLGVAGRHLYILAHPGLSCGIDPLETSLNKVFTAHFLPFMFKADGLCEAALAPFFGLSIPQWAFLWFALFGIALAWTLVRRK